jgi:hypothetical protein
MSVPDGVVFESRVDDFSYQVYTNSDKRFWFRLVRERDRDLITDFFLGSFPPTESGALLERCYRTLALTPRKTLVFRDILSSKEVSPRMRKEAQEQYTEAGKTLLAAFGIANIDARVEESRGKLDLTLTPRS